MSMNVLVACEESQEVCKAFRAKGHRAFSCDIQPCSGGHPEWHIQGDVLPYLNGDYFFTTCDGVLPDSTGDLIHKVNSPHLENVTNLPNK